MSVEATAIATALRQGLDVPDELFDRVFPKALRRRSELHWSPVEVARAAAGLLARCRCVLDVGAGAGKACLVGALATPARWTGIERDGELVAAGRAAATALGVDHRVTLAEGAIGDAAWADCDGFYLYNPFGEALHAPDDPLRVAWHADVALVEERLAARRGTRVVTYHGFGGRLAGYELVSTAMIREAELCLWVS